MSLLLGIETSCDETGAAVVADGTEIRSNVVASQVELHARYGGVFPEMASREHVRKIVPIVDQALREASVTWRDLEAIAVTCGPGLAGSLLVGVNAAKGLALARGIPLIGVNHLAGHVYAAWLRTTPPRPAPEFPLVCLIVSGGHTELLLMRGHGDYTYLGGTRDDAAGEAFDKVARLLGLGYPGGPAIQKAAEGGDASRVPMPRAWLEGTDDFSFSGLKTAVLHLVRQSAQNDPNPKLQPSSMRGEIAAAPERIADIAAAFQESVVEVLTEKTRQAAERCGARCVIVGGGVAANRALRERMQARIPVPVLVPPPALCTDNGAVIAAAGHFQRARGERSGWDLDVAPGLRLTQA